MSVRRANSPFLFNVANPLLRPSASGGTISDAGGYRIHTFTNVGNSSLFFTQPGLTEFLVVAGGGGGSAGASGYYGGAGGAGGYITGSFTAQSTEYLLTVGGAGAYINVESTRGNNGTNSSIFSFSAIGGGAGAGGSSAARSGGSGGGGNLLATSGGAGTSGQGFRGGNYNTGGQGAPGGSASGAGPDNSTVASPGLSNSISGSPIVYARGGDGIPSGTGGLGSNNGNGGKAGRPSPAGQEGSNGVNGIVIVRYLV